MWGVILVLTGRRVILILIGRSVVLVLIGRRVVLIMGTVSARVVRFLIEGS